MNTAAIARHLNIVESAITRCEEWASVLFVVIKGLGARFVSKKIMTEWTGTKKQIAWAKDIKANTLSRLSDIVWSEIESSVSWMDEIVIHQVSRDEILEAYTQALEPICDAKWWIEHRDKRGTIQVEWDGNVAVMEKLQHVSLSGGWEAVYATLPSDLQDFFQNFGHWKSIVRRNSAKRSLK